MKSFRVLIAAAASFAVANTSSAAEFNYEGFTLSPYVRIVGGISYVDNSYKAGEAGSKFEVASNQWGTSYIGSSLSVALAEGFRGVANLESGFGTLNGATNEKDVFFNRQANVGVHHDVYGQLTFGTHLSLSQDIVDMDPMSFQAIGVNTLVNGVNDTFSENSIVYRSPNIYGFDLALLKKFGGEVSDSNRSSGEAVSLRYAYNNFSVHAIHQEKADQFGRYTGGKFYGLGTQGQWLYTKTSLLAASYRLGSAKLFAGHQIVKSPDSGHGLSYTFDDEASMSWVGVNYDITSKLTMVAAYYQSSHDYSSKESHLYAVGANYYINDKFTFYGTFGHINNNTISSSLAGDVGVNNHALFYDEVACENTGDCNGAGQTGIYTGVVLKL